MLDLNARQKTALRLLAVLASLPLMAQVTHPRPACAAPSPAASAEPASLKLFPDSTLVPGDRISVEVVGRGPDVVLIPGLASSRETYRRTAERLRGRYRLHLVQVDGFAGAPARANASGPVLAPVVQAIDAYILKAGLQKPAVVGHSLGGVMAFELAAEHPDREGKVMIVDSLLFYSELAAGPSVTAAQAQPFADQLGARMLALPQAAYEANIPANAAGMVTAPADQARLAGWMKATDRPVMVKAMQEDMTTDLRPLAPKVAVPVTVIYEQPLESLMRADYAPVRTKTLVAAAPGAKHFIMDDDPKGFDAALDAFLRS